MNYNILCFVFVQIQSGDSRDQLNGRQPESESTQTHFVITSRFEFTCLYCVVVRVCVRLSQDNSLVVGGGDNNIHILDLEHGVFKV